METQYISLNMTPTGVNPCFHISQYDVGRVLGFIVHSGGATVDLDTYTCTVEATRSDGVAITSAVATTDNIGTFEVTPTMSNKADKYRCQLVIVDANSKRIASLPFDMDVVKAAMDENSESIEEDASLYQQYTEAVQGAIAEANANIQAEENARIAAVAAEATARANADATLQNNINSEASTRASADSNLQSQINQIIAPSGEAPSAAEVQNARIGSDGTVYPTLGDAIRAQNSNLMSRFDKVAIVYTNLVDSAMLENGFTAPDGSGSPSSSWRRFEIPVTAGEKISLTGSRIMTCYYADSTVVSGGDDSGESRVDTVPETANKLRISFQYADIDTVAVVKADTVIGIDQVGTAIPANTFDVYNREHIDYIENSVAKISPISLLTNLLIGATLKNGFTSPDGSGSSLLSWRRFDLTVAGGEKYSIAGGRAMTCFYASDNSVVTGGIDSISNRVEVVPLTATRMRISFEYANIDEMVVTKSDDVVDKDKLAHPLDLFETVHLYATPLNYRSVLESIIDSSFFKRYMVHLSAGTYDIWSMMTAEEKSDSTFKGFYTPKFTILFGEQNGVVIKCEADTQKSRLSPVNLDATASIINCKVTAKKCRYAIHDDWQDRKWQNDTSLPDYWTPAFTKGFERICRNVETEIEDSYVGASWGCGVVNAVNWIYQNCKIGSGGQFSYICHNDNQIALGANVTLENCRCGSGIRFSSLNQGNKADCYAHLVGTSATGVRLSEEDASAFGAGIRWHIDGFANTFGNEDVIINNTDGVDYSANVNLI